MYLYKVVDNSYQLTCHWGVPFITQYNKNNNLTTITTLHMKQFTRNSRFAHDVTKIYTKELSILLSSYFHEVLQQLNNFIYANVRFEGFLVLRWRTLEFPISSVSVTRHLAGDLESAYVG